MQFTATPALLTDTTPKKTYDAVEGNSTKTQVLATFTDANATAQPGDFTPTVTWNGTLDGTPTVSVQLVSRTKTVSKWKVVGSATYADVGTYAAAVFVEDTAGNMLLSSGKTQFKVAGAALHDATKAKTYKIVEGASTGTQVLATSPMPTLMPRERLQGYGELGGGADGHVRGLGAVGLQYEHAFHLGSGGERHLRHRRARSPSR